MPLHAKAFWVMSFFLVGVALFSASEAVRGNLTIIVVGTALLALFFVLRGQIIMSLLVLSIIMGAGYGAQYAERARIAFTAPLGTRIALRGMIERVIEQPASAQVDLRLLGDVHGKVRATVARYPTLRYGDSIAMTGVLKAVEGPSAGYFKKEGIGATISFPKDMTIVSRDNGSRIKALLFDIRDSVRSMFAHVLAPQQATLMTGLVLGKSSGFDKQFTEKLKSTGTTHLVALSGYNIAVIITGLLYVFGFVVNRRYAVWLCVVALIGFVIMTGAEASVVRAALMATVMIIAERTSRMYSVRNAIVATALVMTLINPRILMLDVGFQLSFMALIGIVYVKPALEILLRIKKNPGWLGWRVNLTTTLAAQIAVLPILLSSFGFFSPLSILTNVLLLAFIPYTMGLGLCIIAASLLSSHLAFLVALPARALLTYELGIIDFFARLPVGFTLERIPFIAVLLYYAALAGSIVYAHRRARKYAGVAATTV